MRTKIKYLGFILLSSSVLFACSSNSKNEVKMEDFIQTAQEIRSQHKTPITIAYVSRYDYKQ